MDFLLLAAATVLEQKSLGWCRARAGGQGPREGCDRVCGSCATAAEGAGPRLATLGVPGGQQQGGISFKEISSEGDRCLSLQEPVISFSLINKHSLLHVIWYL